MQVRGRCKGNVDSRSWLLLTSHPGNIILSTAAISSRVVEFYRDQSPLFWPIIMEFTPSASLQKLSIAIPFFLSVYFAPHGFFSPILSLPFRSCCEIVYLHHAIFIFSHFGFFIPFTLHSHGSISSLSLNHEYI